MRRMAKDKYTCAIHTCFCKTLGATRIASNCHTKEELLINFEKCYIFDRFQKRSRILN